jgi:hypothetical protein
MLEGLTMAWELGDIHVCGTAYIKVVEQAGNEVKVRFCTEGGELKGPTLFGPYLVPEALPAWTFHKAAAPREFQLGDVVRIRPDSQFYGRDKRSNPAGVDGVIRSVGPEDERLRFMVDWKGLSSNSYAKEDLFHVGEQPIVAPVLEPKKVAKPSALKQAIIDCYDGSDDTAHYWFVHSDNTSTEANNTACHAQVRHFYNDLEKTPKWIVSSISEGLKYKAYLKWLIDDSVWSVCFRYRSAWCFKHRCVVVYTDVDANLMQTALVATRQGWEHKPFTECFQRLLSYGVEGHIALRIAISEIQGELIKGKYVMSEYNPGHFPLESVNTIESLSKFRRGQFSRYGVYNKVKSFHDTAQLFRSEGTSKTIMGLYRAEFGTSPGSTWGGGNPKPTDKAGIIKFAKMLEEMT